MGVTLDQWRLRIGCFNPNAKTKTKNAWFLNENAYGGLCKILLLGKLLLCVSLLLLVSGNVEVNPGPAELYYKSCFPIQGRFHQGNELFSEESRGRQCLPCCVVFLVSCKLKPFRNIKWKTDDLDQVLLKGDYVYRFSKEFIRPSKGFLEPRDLPPFTKINGKYFYWKVRNTFSGSIQAHFVGEYPLVRLETAILMGLSGNVSNCQFGIFICKGNALAICKDGDIFLIFDSHSRDVNGYSCADGTSIIIQKKSMNELCDHLRYLVNAGENNEQYDFHVINVNETSEHCIRFIHKASEASVCQIPEVITLIMNENLGSTPAVGNAVGRVELIELPFLRSEQNKKSKDTLYKSRKRKSEHLKKDFPPPKKLCSCETIISNFHRVISHGPEYICISCNQVFFKHSVSEFNLNRLSSTLVNSCTTSITSVENKKWICIQCKKYLNDDKVPPCSVGNGFKFPCMPKELQGLTKLEERLISPRIPFMQIKELPRGGQIAMHGNLINVPADVNKTVKLLPRNMNESETIPLKLKRSVNYKTHIAFEHVRPEKIIEAAKWLIHNSRLFRNEGISLNTEWSAINGDTLMQEKEIANSIHNESRDLNEESANCEVESEQWSENDEAVLKPAGNFDTVMQPADFREFNRILSVAPAEGNSPLGMFQDINAEFLSFPTIYCGESRQNNNSRITPVHYSTICKWELRNADRRVAHNVTNIFFKLKKLQIKQISDKVSLAVRKCKLNGKKLTVDDVLTEGSINNIVKHNEGYRVLRTLRGSPPYWEKTKKDIYSMIRQLGIPTWFCSFSAAETKWKVLLRVLGKLVKNKTYSDSEIDNMTWSEKNELIKSDPVTCARYFDFRLQMFFNNVLKHESAPVGKIKDFFFRIEFQQRGSPHVHILLWIDGAPKLGQNSEEEIGSFINKYVTCKKNPSIPNLVNYQTHRHARTCRKKGKSICRFGFPMPPLDKTLILEGLDENESNEISAAQKNYENIMAYLNSYKPGDNCDFSFKDFLQSMKLSYKDYILALRSSVKAGQKKVFLKRNISEIRINNYNELLIKCWEANMDIQFILDPYACAAYIVSYISKGQRGMSDLLSTACKEAKSSESDIKQQVRKIGNTFLSHVEIGAQEACYLVLQMPLRRCSREVVFVDTNNENDRVIFVKSKSALEDLPKTSTSIESDSNINRYQRRPASMSKYNLADFIALFNITFPNKAKKTVQERDDTMNEELPETSYDVNKEDDIEFDEANDMAEEHVFKDGTVMKKRTVSKVIYSVGFNKDNDKENFCREQLMLYIPWRNYADIFGGYITYEARYLDNKEEIDNRRKIYVDDTADNLCQLEKDFFSNQVDDPVVTGLQHEDERDANEGSCQSQDFGCFNPGNTSETSEYDLALDMNIGRKQILNDEHLTGELNDDEYRDLVQKLNIKQKEFFYHVLHWMKTKDDPIYHFLSGGAGVGKSVLLRALYQALTKYFSHKAGENPDEVKVIICAPTGKAAFNVGGSTIHSVFNIPAEQGFNYKPLDMQQLGTFQSNLKSLKVVFIDEISMVGRKMFNYINLRLQEILGSLKPFGGVSVIAFGDLYQLKPVMDQWIFKSNISSESQDILAPNLWVENFLLFELDEIMRQKDDVLFAQILNRLREGQHNVDDVQILSRRIVKENELTKNVPHLFPTRNEVSNHNRNIFDQLDESKKTIVQAIDTISGELPNSMIEKILSKVPDDATKTKGLMKHLCLGEELPAEICVNIDVKDGMTNGTPCIVKRLDFRVLGSKRCSIVWVKFFSEDIGKKCRSRFKHLYNNLISSSWTPILEITRKFSFNYYKSFCITRRQFPLTLAAAKTVHKAQGSTLETAVIGLGNKKLEHLYYVALSRVQKLASVYLLNFEEKSIKVSELVIEEMNRLRTSAKISISIPLLYYLPQNVTTIIYQNCRSLKRHISDIKKERSLLTANILAFAETCLNSNDNSSDYELDGFALFRNDDICCQERPYHGTIVYSKVSPNAFNVDNILNIELTCGYIFHENSKINVCFVYCPPKIASFSLFKEMFAYLHNKIDLLQPCIIMGDFNLDFFQVKMLPNHLRTTYSLYQLINSATTNYDTVIDHVYTNIDKSLISISGVLESYFSDHKPVFIALQ